MVRSSSCTPAVDVSLSCGLPGTFSVLSSVYSPYLLESWQTCMREVVGMAKARVLMRSLAVLTSKYAHNNYLAFEYTELSASRTVCSKRSRSVCLLQLWVRLLFKVSDGQVGSVRVRLETEGCLPALPFTTC